VGAGGFTVNTAGPLVPPLVVTVTFAAPVAAVAEMISVAVIWVVLTTATLLTITPVLLTATAAPATKFVPARVTGTLVPWTPLAGLTEVSVGAGGRLTLNDAVSVWPSMVALPEAAPALLPAVYVELAEPASVVALAGLSVPSVPENATGVPSATATPVLPSLALAMLAVKVPVAPA
jgi:hypothetical protein